MNFEQVEDFVDLISVDHISTPRDQGTTSKTFLAGKMSKSKYAATSRVHAVDGIHNIEGHNSALDLL